MSPAPPRRVAAIVPARDEASTVGFTVRSLAARYYTGEFRIFVVDDHSRDGTAQEARAAGAEVLAAAPLPQGWTGKLWAVSQGIAAASAFEPEYFLLTDADIVHPPDLPDRLVSLAESGGYDLVSFMVRLHCESLAEKYLIPAFVFFFFLLYPPRWVRDPRRGTAGAAGGCILIRRRALERIGGIQAIRGAWIDDCALAAAVKRSGGTVWLGLSSRSGSLRRYESFGEVGRMISRTAFTELRHSPLLLAGTVAGMLLGYGAPPVLALSGQGAARKMGLAAWGLMSVAYAPALRSYGVPVLCAPLLPLVACFYTGATIHSAIAHWRGGAAWKGRPQQA